MPVPELPIPTPHRLLRPRLAGPRLLAAALAFSFLFPIPYSLVPAFAKGSEPSLRIPLEDLGFQSLSPEFLLNGSSMLTVHYIDDKHLLLTFVVHRLIPRLADEPEDDQDRVVDALLLELPSGRVLSRTTWHLHDHSQYLWSLGHGHFLLRIRDTLTSFAPLANLSTGQPFAQHPFLVSGERRLAAVILSPDTDLLIIESVKRTPPPKKPKTDLFGPAMPPTPQLVERDRVQINFYRIRAGDDGGPVQRRFAGVVQAQSTGDVPASTAGYLAIVDLGRQHWAFDFHSYTGKTDELASFDSACSPAPLFVSHSEFIAFGCKNGQTRQLLGGFNMRGEQMWQQGLFGDFIAPSLAYAPAGGRFALSRIMLRSSAIADQPISSDQVSTQSVVVYQIDSGKQLLRVDCSPIERAGQNFALSPDGMALAVVHADAIEIYTLPPLTDKDQAAVKLARSSAPPETDIPVHFNQQPAEAESDSATDSTERPGPQPFSPQPFSPTPPTTTANVPSDSAPAQGQPASPTPPVTAAAEDTKASQPPAAQPLGDPSGPSSGDAAPEQHRPPPTLYTLPGDKRPTSEPASPKDIPPQ
jgi:hypothetical protein